METYREEVKHHHTVLRLDLGDLGLHSLQLSPQGLGGGMVEKLRSHVHRLPQRATWRATSSTAASRLLVEDARTT